MPDFNVSDYFCFILKTSGFDLPLPPKKVFGNMDSAFIQERRAGLQVRMLDTRSIIFFRQAYFPSPYHHTNHIFEKVRRISLIQSACSSATAPSILINGLCDVFVIDQKSMKVTILLHSQSLPNHCGLSKNLCCATELSVKIYFFKFFKMSRFLLFGMPKLIDL